MKNKKYERKSTYSHGVLFFARLFAPFIGLLIGYSFVSISNMELAQAQDIQVLETKIDMQIVKSEDGLYYIQCIDSCKEWYATGDVGELFQGFLLSCEAMNFWKQKWHETYGGVYLPLECEFSWVGFSGN